MCVSSFDLSHDHDSMALAIVGDKKGMSAKALAPSYWSQKTSRLFECTSHRQCPHMPRVATRRQTAQCRASTLSFLFTADSSELVVAPISRSIYPFIRLDAQTTGTISSALRSLTLVNAMPRRISMLMPYASSYRVDASGNPRMIAANFRQPTNNSTAT
jgi:hypothetical protein